MSEINETVPAMDHDVDGTTTGQTEAELLDAVLRNSDFTKDIVEPLPVEEVPEVDPTESEEEVEEPEASEEVDEEYEETEEVEESDEDGAEEAPTQEADVFDLDDLDLDAQVRVKVDGEEFNISFGEMLKGYQTDSSLSKKGRELGEQRKAFEEEVEQAKAQLSELGETATAVLYSREQTAAKDYHEAEAAIKKAVEDGDTWEVDDLKEKRDAAQKQYWEAHNEREALGKKLEEQKAAEHSKKLEAFNSKINDMIPGFSPEIASELREFALAEGVAEEVVDTVTDPAIVKMLHELKSLRNASSKGAEKRKAVPAKKAVPTKKAKTPAKKKQDAEQMVKARALRENATKDDHDAYARLLASKTLGNL